jgi:hypothetical protein
MLCIPSLRSGDSRLEFELTYHLKLEIETGLLIILTIWSFLISHMFLI